MPPPGRVTLRGDVRQCPEAMPERTHAELPPFVFDDLTRIPAPRATTEELILGPTDDGA